jgi:hypothetical protein
MPIRYRAEPSIGCTFDVWDGNVSAGDIREHLVRLASDRSWPAGQSHLTDLTTLVEAPAPDPQVLDALYEGTSLSNDLKVAVVVPASFPSDVDLRYGTVTEHLTARKFTDLRLACTYLDVDEAAARAILAALRNESPQGG